MVDGAGEHASTAMLAQLPIPPAAAAADDDADADADAPGSALHSAQNTE